MHHASIFTFRAGLLGWALAGLASVAGAQPIGVHFRSLEARIAEADLVFYGKIAEVLRTETVPPGGATVDGTTWPDGWAEYILTVKVEENLKGGPKDKVSLFRKTSAKDQRIDRWFEAGTPFLWFAAERDEAVPLSEATSRGFEHLRLGPELKVERGYASSHYSPSLFSLDLSVLDDPMEILGKARAFARKHPERAPVIKLEITAQIAKRCGTNGWWNSVFVPVVPALEPLARRLIAAPEEFMPKDQLDDHSRCLLRLSGMSALAHFKSAENKALLKPLLHDGTEIEGIFDDAQRTRKRPIERFPIRAQAREILESWNADPPK